MTERRENRGTIQRSARPKRVSVAEQRNRLTVENRDPSRHYRWVSDVGNRINVFLNAGYRIETDSTNLTVGDETVSKSSGVGTPIKEYGGKDSEGNKFFQFLMSIPNEYYDEDQENKMKDVMELEDGMTQLKDDVDYVKEAKIGTKLYRDANIDLE